MTQPFPEPTLPADSRAEVLVRYLDYFRSRVIERIGQLPEPELRRSRLPSRWTPLELARHLAFVEMRWLEWGFEGRSVENPWDDTRDDQWFVPESESRAELVEGLRRQGQRSRDIVENAPLDQVGRPGPRWDGAEPPTLERILLHLIQEYARHLGHLDIVSELSGGSVGE
jgi:uncharacterized damage-inducible protein DinB